MEDLGEVRPNSSFKAEEEGVARRLPFGGYNEEGELVFEVGEVLVEGEDYVTEEYTKGVPQRR